MTKEKRIEEIAGVLFNEIIKTPNMNFRELSRFYATALYNAGYRKKGDFCVDEGVVAKWHYMFINDGREDGWKEILDAKEHCGDCTNECHTCMVCLRENCFDQAHALATADIIKEKEE